MVKRSRSSILRTRTSLPEGLCGFRAGEQPEHSHRRQFGRRSRRLPAPYRGGGWCENLLKFGVGFDAHDLRIALDSRQTEINLAARMAASAMSGMPTTYMSATATATEITTRAPSTITTVTGICAIPAVAAVVATMPAVVTALIVAVVPGVVPRTIVTIGRIVTGTIIISGRRRRLRGEVDKDSCLSWGSHGNDQYSDCQE